MTDLLPAFTAGFLTYLALVVAIGAQTLFLLRQIVRRDRVGLVLGVCLAADVVLLTAGTAGIGVVAERLPWLVPGLTAAGVVYLLWFAATALRSAVRGERTLAAAAAEAGDDELAPTAREVAVLTGQLPLIDPETGRPADEAVRGRAPEHGAVGRLEGVAPAGREAAPAVRPSGGVDVAVRAPEVRRVRLSTPQTPLPRIVLLALSVSLLNPHAILDTVVMMGTFAQTHGEAKWGYAGGAMTAGAVWFALLGWGGMRLAPYLNSPRAWRVVDGTVAVLMLVIAVKVALTLV